MNYRKNRSRHNSLESIIERKYLSIKKQCTRKDGILLIQDSTIKKMGWTTKMLERI